MSEQDPQPGHAQSPESVGPLPPKLLRVQPHRGLPRQRLLQRMRESLAQSSVWISAGPGSGKTLLASSYVDACRRPCLWYRIDNRDRDPATFFHYLRRLALAVAPGEARRLPNLTPEYLAGLDVYARNFFESFFALVEAGSVLVFDDLQYLGEESITSALLAAGLEQTPQSLQIILASRELPGPPFARLLANESLRVIQNAELALDADEAQLIARQHGRSLRPERVDDILRQTQGWAAGFTLMVDQAATEGGAARLAIGHIFDYFSAEVLTGIAPDTLDLLLQSAWLPRMPRGLVDRLCQNAEAGRKVAGLWRRNYFTNRSGGPDPVYEYHPLFRDCLLRHARQHWPRERLDTVRRRAALLLIEEGQTEDALELLVALEEWSRLSELLQVHVPALLAEGRGQFVLSLLEAVPGAEVEGRPWLLYWKAACLMPLDIVLARNALERAARQFRALKDGEGELLACAAIMDSYFHQRGDFHPLDRWIRRMEALLARYPQSLDEPGIGARVTCAMFSAFMARQPGNPAFRQWIARAERLMLDPREELQRLSLATHLVAYYTWWSGDSPRASTIVRDIDPCRNGASATPLSQIVWCAASAIHHWASLDFAACIQTAQRGLELSADSGIHLWDFLLLALCSWGAIFSDDERSAGAYLERMADTLRAEQHLDVSHYHFQHFVLAHRRGDPAAMLLHADATWHHAHDAGDPWAEGLGLVARARAMAAHGDWPSATQLLGRAQARVKGDAGSTIVYACLLARAEWTFDVANPDAGLPELRKLMQFARRKNIIFSNWERDEVMAELCVRALEHGIETDFVRHLVSRRRLVPREPPQHLDNWPWQLDIDTFGHFEVRVDGAPLRFSGKSQKRPLALLKAIIALGGRDVPETRLSDALWPDAEGDTAQQSLATTLHRLRQLVGTDAIQRRDGFLGLDVARCRVDLWACERHLDSVESLLSNDGAVARIPPNDTPPEGETSQDPRVALQALHSALALYRGPFLDGEAYVDWALPARERVRHRVLRQILAVADALQRNGDDALAIGCYERGLEIDELAEECYRGLLHCHVRSGHRAAGLRVYRRCVGALRRGLGIEPSGDVEDLRRALDRL